MTSKFTEMYKEKFNQIKIQLDKSAENNDLLLGELQEILEFSAKENDSFKLQNDLLKTDIIAKNRIIETQDNIIENYRVTKRQLNKNIISLNENLNKIQKILSTNYFVYSKKIWHLLDLFPSFQNLLRNKLLGKAKDLSGVNSQEKIENVLESEMKIRKIAYIGHSYHSKTKSTGFLIDILKEFFEVEVMLDYSWNGGPAPRLELIDETYFAVVFFQKIPDAEIVKTIKCKNIIFFPMYDNGLNLPFEYWAAYDNLKIINFSRTLNDKLVEWKFNSKFFQYYPKPKPFIPGDISKVFFWQRIPSITFDTIKQVLPSDIGLQIHIHKAVDPNVIFSEPSEEDVAKYSITYSDWTPTREEMHDKYISPAGIYIAPRVYEGIGLSFLEAMTYGKIVIAPNNPTMNEYITDGYNGFLYDLNNINPIKFKDNLTDIQKNVYEFMETGYQNWEESKYKIIDFINEGYE